MKSYLDFTLTGKKFLPLWLAFYFLFFVPYVNLQEMRNPAINSTQPATLIYIYSFSLILIAFAFTFFLLKMIIQHVVLNEVAIKCDFKFGEYLEVLGKGILLSMITLFIYAPWFMRDMNRFFINNSSYHSNKFTFLGKGVNLLLILLLTVVLPIIVLIILVVNYPKIVIETQSILFKFVHQMIVLMIIVPYIYLVYKWMVDIKYKDYYIRWETEFFPSVGKCALELVLSMITFGIYIPMAFIRLYKYFTERTKSNVVDGKKISFGYDIDLFNDFLYFWGQIVLTILTLGIYYPWAFCKITKRVLERTYIQVAE